MLQSLGVPLRHIDKTSTQALERAIHATLHGKTLEIAINCKGGDVIEGLKMMKFISESGITINGTVCGEAGSMAAVILQCMNVRRMTQGSFLHYHYGSWRISFLAYYDREIAERNHKKAVEYQQALILPIMKRTGMTEEGVHELLREDKRLTATEALSRNLIDEIT